MNDGLYSIFNNYDKELNKILRLCRDIKISSNGETISVEKYLKRPLSNICDQIVPEYVFNNFSDEALFSAETKIKYEGYVKIEFERVKKIKKMDAIKIPKGFDYGALNNISSESKEKLTHVLPETLGQANRIAGVRPSDISVLAIYLSVST